jgi:hypothetical protein
MARAPCAARTTAAAASGCTVPIHPFQVGTEKVLEKAEQLGAEPAASSLKLGDVAMQTGEELAMDDLVRIQLRVAEVGHVLLLLLEVVSRVALELPQQLA